MRNLTLFMSMSLDGFIGGPDEGETSGNDPAEDHRFANELFAAADPVLFGRITYEGFIGYWDTLDLSDASVPLVEVEFARTFRRLKRVVFSRTLAQVADHTLLVSGNLADAVLTLKQQPGKDLLLVCGPELLASLIALNLVDEIQLLISPTLLGHGQSLFGNLLKTTRLQLVATRTFDSGSVLHHYRISFPSLEEYVPMDLSITQVAEAFSRHEFERTFPYLMETIQWSLIGQEGYKGREAVINACQQSANYLASVTTRFSRFTVLVGADFVVIDSTADYIGTQQSQTTISSCDIYTFTDGKLAAITSYSVHVE